MSDEANQNTDLKTVVSEEVSAQTLPEPIQAEIKNDDSTSPADFVLAKSDREVVSEEIKFNTANSSPATLIKNDPVVNSNETEPASAEAKTIDELAVLGFTKPANTFMRWLWKKALKAKRARQRKKLDRIMTLFAKHPKITNDLVEKLLHVSHSTATKYLKILLTEKKISRTAQAGSATTYIKL